MPFWLIGLARQYPASTITSTMTTATSIMLCLEHCVGRPFADPRGFWQEVGSLLARIHAMFWDDTGALPAVFDVPRSDAWAWESVRVLTDYVDGLNDDQRATLDDMVGTCWRDLADAAASLEPERMPRTAHSAVRCLVHRAFHAPEIMWREVAGGGYESLAVDWEKASIGVPGQDFRVVSELLSDGRDDLVDTLFDAYFTTLSQHGIRPDVEALRASAYCEAFFDQMVGTRWLLRKYVYVRDDPQLESWREWARQVMPGRIRYLLNNWNGLGEP